MGASLPDMQGRKLCIVSDSRVAHLYLDTVRNALSECFDATTSFVFPKSNIEISSAVIDLDEEHLEKFKRFLSILEEYDDFENIYHNANLPEEDEEE